VTVVVGVDVGLRGGLAAVRLLETGPFLVDVIDVPVLDSKAKARVDAIAVQEWLLQHSPCRAFIEVTSAWPKQGISSAYRFGRAAGALESIITVCGIPIEYVAPATWKKALKLRGQNKEASRAAAIRTFSSAHHLLKRKCDHGRAESALHHLMLARPEPDPAPHPVVEAPLVDGVTGANHA
jgi:Holliday junction resolvasome RuvABC endonuclease subunit